jgi:hypothetical protein
MATIKKFAGLFLFVFVATFSSCDPGDMHIKRMYGGDGVWTIESLQWQYYDSLGENVVVDSTHDDYGEMVFYRTKGTNALFDHYCVVVQVKTTNGTFADYPGEVFFDGLRANMQEDPYHGFPDQLKGVWTVLEDHRKSQVWEQFTINSNGYMGSRKTLTLKKIKI